MTWAELFDRAECRDVDEETIGDALARHREADADE